MTQTVSFDPGTATPVAAPTAQRPVTRRWDWLNRIRMGDRIGLSAVGIGAAVLSTVNLVGAPDFQDDEGTYTAQAMSVLQGDLAPYTYWYDHPPFGWIQLAALVWIPRSLGLGEGTDIGAMRYVIALFFVVNALLVYLLARRMRARIPFAVLAAGVFALSPLSLILGRQVFLDTVAMPWLLLAFYVALSPRLALWHHVSAGMAFAVALLSKLTMAVFGPALLVAMLDRAGWRGRAFSIVGFLTVGGLSLALYPLMALLRGELISGPDHVSLQDALTYQFVSRKGSGYIWEADSARAELVQGWLYYDTYLIVGGLVAVLLCLTTRRTRWIAAAVACFALPVVATQGYLPAMYIVGGIPLLALAIGVAADLIWRGAMYTAHRFVAGARLSPPMIVGAVLTAVVVLIPIPHWIDRDGQLVSTNSNADWLATLDWAAEELPHDEVVIVPYSMWQDLNSRGWHDPWQAVVLEKVDLDSSFAQEHPGGWREIQWIIEGPTVVSNIDSLGLTEVKEAYENSTIVRSFGSWNIRQVTPPD